MAETISVDLCVIGGGLAGISAAVEASRLGASVVLVERHRLGGGYLYSGTVPARALAAAAGHAHAMRSAAQFGIADETPRVNARKVHDAIHEIIAGLAPKSAIAQLEAQGVQVVSAEASFADHHTVIAGEDRITARSFIIATGARSVVPPIPGLDGVPYFTTETIFDNTRRLTHLLIIGSAPAALELAQAYNRLGTEVTVVADRQPLSGVDPELAAVALDRMREEGVALITDATVAEIQPRSQGIGAVVNAGGEEIRLDVSHILVADARVPNVEPLDLGKAGIRRHRADPYALDLTLQMRTSNRRVFVAGDATGKMERAHLAGRQAEAVARHALLMAPLPPEAVDAPVVYYTDPEIALVGLTEQSARTAHGTGFEVLRTSLAENDRARATRQAYGVIKLIVARDGRLLGAGMAGDRAGEVITTLGLAVAQKLKLTDLAAGIAPHATLSESIVALARDYRLTRGVTPLTQRLMALRRLLP